MEDAVYICSWSRSRDGYELWVKSRPHLRATAPTYPQAEEWLIRAIQDAGGAMHAVLEFDPPLPRSRLEEKYADPQIFLVAGDDHFETGAPRWRYSETAKELDERLRWSDAFYERPVCRKCRHAPGRRSEKPLTVKYISSGYDGAFGSVGTDGGPTHLVFSEEFLALLTPEEVQGLELRPTLRRGQRKFYELVGPQGAPPVAVKSMNPSGWRCGHCGHATWGYWIEGLAIRSFVARSQLPAPLPSVFAVGVYPEIQLAVTATRWSQLNSSP
jgi:hypothetical protein